MAGEQGYGILPNKCLTEMVGQKYSDDGGEIFNCYDGTFVNEASGLDSHAEGRNTTASAGQAHAEGYGTTASGEQSHAEGRSTTALGSQAHAEGNTTNASGSQAHAEGNATTASGGQSHAEGANTVASGICAHAEGRGTAAYDYQHVQGTYNVVKAGGMGTSGDKFIIGKGTSASSKSNAFRVSSTGGTYGNGAFNTSGADYAEMFEWTDGNVNNEDRRGLFVTLDGDKIRLANADDDYILGAVSAKPAIVGDSYFGDNWHGMYLTDLWENLILSEQTIVLDDGEEYTGMFPTINPEWDGEQEYMDRSERPEWAAIGMIGKLIVVDDGTCQVNGYCAVSNGGIATAAAQGYRVMKRIDDTHVMVLFRHV